jgi:hypothetical protein
MITLAETKVFPEKNHNNKNRIAYSMSDLWLGHFDNINRMITISVITLTTKLLIFIRVQVGGQTRARPNSPTSS